MFLKRVRNVQGVLSFRHWNRKGYSIFNSIGRLVRIGKICLTYSLVSLPVFVIGQTDTTSVSKILDLDEVVISAQKAPVVYSQSARIVNVLTAEDLESLPVGNVTDVLDYVPGIDVRQRGANGVQADISIRGGSFDQNLVMLNGINITDPQTGHHNFNLPIDFNSIDHIEILKGPGSRVFGPNAFGGAVNIITNQTRDNFTRVGFTAGDFGLFNANLTTQASFGNFINTLAVSKDYSKGFTKNTDFTGYSLFYNGTLDSEQARLDLQLGHSEKAFGANSFYTPAYPDQFEEVKATFASLKLSTGEFIKVEPAIYWRRHQDRFELFRDEAPSWYTSHNYHLTDVLGAKIDARKSTDWGTTVIGAEFRSENIWSNKLGELMNDTIDALGDEDGVYTRSYSRTEVNYFLEQSIYLDRFYISAGLLMNWNSEQDFEINIFPGIDLGFDITESFKLYSSVNKSLRMPTFTDLFYVGPSNLGNPNLDPEESWNFEAGIKVQNKIVKGDAAYFYRKSDNLIAWVKDTAALDTDPWETQNLTDITIQGFELSTSFDLSGIVYKDLIDKVSIGYTFVDQQKADDEYDSKYSLNYLRHKVNLNVNHKIYKDLYFSWSATYQDREGAYVYYDRNLQSYTGDRDYKPFLLFDARLSYKWRYMKFFAEATNIFNNDYVDIGNVEQPGRWFKAGITVNLKY